MAPKTNAVREKLEKTWVFIEKELTDFWTKLCSDGTFTLGTATTSSYYSRVYGTFSSVQTDSRIYYYGVDRNHPGVLHAWLDTLLHQIQLELEASDFTENTFRKIGHISLIGKLAKLLFSQLDAGQVQNAEQRINEALLQGAFFRSNRGRIIEKCLTSISSARSGNDVSMQLVASMFQLLMVASDDPFATPTTANQGLTTLGAPEIAAEYIQSMEAYYKEERVKRLENPEHHDRYPRWANECYAKELIWARQCLQLRTGTDQHLYTDRVKRSFNDTVITSAVDVLLSGSIHGLSAQVDAYPVDTVAAQLKALYLFIRGGDEFATVKNLPTLEKKLGELFAARVTRTIEAYAASEARSAHIDFSNGISEGFAHFNSIVKECFQQYGGFTTELRKQGKAALKKYEPSEKQYAVEKCLSLDIDSTITGKNTEKSEDEITARLSRISAVVAFLSSAQDVFDRYHIGFLEERLLSTRNDPTQRKYDKKLLEVIRKDDGKFDVHPSDRRLRDIEQSEELVSTFPEALPKVERVLFLSSTAWSLQQSKWGAIFIPPTGEIKTILDGLRSAFFAKKSNCTLSWLHFKGTAILKAKVEVDGNPRLFNYQMTIAQAALAMYIQEQPSNSVTFTDLVTKCFEVDGIKCLKENLGDLMTVKRGGKPCVPLVRPSNGKFDHTTVLNMNSKFPTTHTDFKYISKNTDNDDFSGIRTERIKVCMVRYMKANQRADYTALSEHVKSEAPSKFRMPEPTTVQIKKVLDLLMSGTEQYIRRDEEDNRTFVYIA